MKRCYGLAWGTMIIDCIRVTHWSWAELVAKDEANNESGCPRFPFLGGFHDEQDFQSTWETMSARCLYTDILILILIAFRTSIHGNFGALELLTLIIVLAIPKSRQAILQQFQRITKSLSPLYQTYQGPLGEALSTAMEQGSQTHTMQLQAISRIEDQQPIPPSPLRTVKDYAFHVLVRNPEPITT